MDADWPAAEGKPSWMLNDRIWEKGRSQMSARLFVGNLSFRLSDEELREAFAKVGVVERAEVVRDRFDGRSRGFGFVEMARVEDGAAAIHDLNGAELAGRPMRVEAATSVRRDNQAALAERTY
jgi:RNA recognition motif-containing protein